MKHQWRETVAQMQYLAPAKLNLFLQVFNQKVDQYHILQSLMVPIDLCDEIIFTPTPNQPDSAVTYGFNPQLGSATQLQEKISKNCIVTKTLLAFQAAADVKPLPFAIRIYKNIPIEAGLGGGSSNAATVLLAANNLLNIPLPEDKIFEIALKLGADVPFFLCKQSSLAFGIGEVLFPVKLPAKWFLIINPKRPISTQQAFNELVSYAPSDQKYKILAQYIGKLQHYFRGKSKNNAFDTFQPKVVIDHSFLNENDIVVQKNFPNLLTNQHNSFHDKLLKLDAKLKKIYELSNYSCRFSGTGSTMFIECNDKIQALSDHAKLSKNFKNNDLDCSIHLVKSY